MPNAKPEPRCIDCGAPPGQIVGKAWMTLAAVVLLAVIRPRLRPVA